MAIRYAVATGNWSNTATWDGGTLPTSSDDVYANGFTVTIDQDVTVLSLRNTANTTPAVTVGGDFTVSGTRTIELTGDGLVWGAATTLTFAGSSAGSLTTTAFVNTTTAAGQHLSISTSGNVSMTCAGNITGGNSGSRFAILLSGGGTHTLEAPEFIGGGGGSGHCISSTHTGHVTIIGDLKGSGTSNVSFSGGRDATVNGNLIGGTSSGAYSYVPGANAVTVINGNVIGASPTYVLGLINAGVDATVNGNVTGGTGSNQRGVQVSGASTLTVNGNVAGNIGTNANGILVSNTGAVVTVNGIVSGGTSNAASRGIVLSVANTTPTTINGEVVGSAVSSGMLASAANSRCNVNGPVKAGSGAAGISITDAAIINIDGNVESNGAFPAISSTVATATLKLEGTIKAASGTFPVHAPFTIVPGGVDIEVTTTASTVVTLSEGSGGYPAADIAEAVWGYGRADVVTAGSIGERLKEVSTVATTGTLLADGFGTSVTESGTSYGVTDAGLLAIADTVWGYPRSSATVTDSMGLRLREAGTVDTTGAQIAGFGE
jgi:fibronectin-binding autotransporter adhesin